MQTPSPTYDNPAAILDDLQERGLLEQTSAGLDEHLKVPRTLYCGFDPTADSLHIGSLVPLLTLRRFQQYGHTPIVLVGGATGMIGDPSFKAQERKLNDDATIAGWVTKLKAQTSRFVAFEGVPNPAKMANNYDWTHGVGVLEFLRDIGKHFSVNAMIARDAVKTRLERENSGISFTEFSYALLQAFDFYKLFEREACTVQLGGSDQWGNMTAGTELVRKKLGEQAFALTLPLVTKADGTKFGKTESGTIWLSPEKTSPYAFYQFWVNTADADVERFLNYFSFRSISDIQDILNRHKLAPEKREAQTALAEELTSLVHGFEAFREAWNLSIHLFDQNINALSYADFLQLHQGGLPSADTQRSIGVIEALVQLELASSKREARDFIQQGAILHNGVTVSDANLVLNEDNARFGAYHLLRRGKKNYALLVQEA
jgi:tyrosyl-tRNA synthetase